MQAFFFLQCFRAMQSRVSNDPSQKKYMLVCQTRCRHVHQAWFEAGRSQKAESVAASVQPLMQRISSKRSHSIRRTNPWAPERSCGHIIPRLPARSEWREMLVHNSGGRNVIHLLQCGVLQNIDERQSAEEVCLRSRTRGGSLGGRWRMEGQGRT